MHDDYFAVIMAGGGGTRLWPLSRSSKPKQLLTLYNEKTFFQLAVERLLPVFRADHILVVTVASQVADLRSQVDAIPLENYLIEPMPRGTASVVGYAAEILQQTHPGAIMAVLTSDHVIENITLFHQILENAYQIAQKDYLVTLGIKPTFPSTGYGYIHKENKLQGFSFETFLVESFVEKPDLERAKKYLASEDYYWNSGMFIWKTIAILPEFERQMPVLYSSLELLGHKYGKAGYDTFLAETWDKITPQTIDYGIMEHAQHVAVIPAEGLGWSDVGSWDSLFEIIQADENGNINLSDLSVIHESGNCLIKTDNDQKMIVLAGLKDIIVVDTKDALLICQKGQSQKVKEIVNEIKQKKLDQFL